MTSHLTLPFDLSPCEPLPGKEGWDRFCQHALSWFIVAEPTHSVLECLRHVNPSSSAALDSPLAVAVSQLCQQLGWTEVGNVLEQAMVQGHINVCSTHISVSAYMASSPQAMEQFSDILKQWLQQGLNDSDTPRTAFVFYLARQASTVGHPTFPSYQDWYQSMFASSTTTAAPSKASFTTLMKFLSGLVPSESPQYLKAHILRPPSIPPRCKDLFDDYVALAKTRLADLKVPLTDLWSGIYQSDNPIKADQETTRVSKTELTNAADKDVEKAVEMFGSNGKIPTALIEASIFRKPYYIGKFLPALLKPRLLPDQPDARARLVESLKACGKISEAMYNKYKQDCDKEKQDLFEGVFDVDADEDMDVLGQGLEHQLSHQFECLRTSLGQESQDQVKECVHSLCSVVNGLVKDHGEKTHRSYLTHEGGKCPLNTDLTSDDWKHTHSRDSTSENRKTMKEKSLSLEECNYDSSHQDRKPLDCNLDQALSDQGLKIDLNRQEDHHHVMDSITLTLAEILGNVLYQQLATQACDCVTHFPAVVKVMCGACPSFRRAAVVAVLRAAQCAEGGPTFLGGIAALCFGLTVCFPDLTVKVRSSNDQDYKLCSNLEKAVVEKILLEPNLLLAFVSCAVNYEVLQRRKLEECDIIVGSPCQNSGSQLLGEAVVRQTTLLLRRIHRTKRTPKAFSEKVLDFTASGVWQELAENAQPSLDEWLLYELRVDPHSDFLTPSERASYLRAESEIFMERNKLSHFDFCKTLFTCLTKCINDDPTNFDKKLSSKPSQIHEFMKILKGHLDELPANQAMHWLTACTTDVHRQQVKAAARLLPHLPPYLAVCNSVKDIPGQQHLGNLRHTLAYLVSASLDGGGNFLSPEVTGWVLQGIGAVRHQAEQQILQEMFQLPILVVSAVVHHSSLVKQALPKEMSQDIQSSFLWLDSMSSAKPNHPSEPQVTTVHKAAVLFDACGKLSEKKFTQVKENVCQEKDHIKIWTLFLALFATNCQLKSLEMNEEETWVARVRAVVERCPQSLVPVVLGQDCVGVLASGQVSVHRMEAWALRMCKGMEPSSLSQSALPAVLINAYCRVLHRFYNQAPSIQEVSSLDVYHLSSWLRGLAKLSSVDLNKIDLTDLKSADPLLYSSVCQRMKTSEG